MTKKHRRLKYERADRRRKKHKFYDQQWDEHNSGTRPRKQRHKFRDFEKIRGSEFWTDDEY